MLATAVVASTDIEIRAKQMLKLRKRLAEIMAKNCGQTVDKVEKDIYFPVYSY